MSLADAIVRTTAHALLGNRRWLRRQLLEVRNQHNPQRILEIGSGRPVNGQYPYSMRSLFPHADFVMSDVDSAHGHLTVDVTTMEFRREFDLILCISVLEHLAEPSTAISRIHEALRIGGSALVATPFAYPLHDEPRDYWRFTEHGLRLLLGSFSTVEIRLRGPRQLPTGVLAIASV